MSSRLPSLISYAAVGTVAALATAYVFSPTLFPSDSEERSGRRAGAVGLSNPGNDCFINSTVQGLAGSILLHEYLSEAETLMTSVRGADDQPHPSETDVVEDLPWDLVTRSLRILLQILSKPPNGRRTASARPLIRALELACHQHLSRQQQDAQEFLQLLLERLVEEHEKRVGFASKNRLSNDVSDVALNKMNTAHPWRNCGQPFPFEGELQSHIQCTTCQFKPPATSSKFTMLTLNVPQKSQVTIDECLDSVLKVETIDDFKCSRCCIQVMIKQKKDKLASCKDFTMREVLGKDLEALSRSLDDGSSEIPSSVAIPDEGLLPRRKISKHITLTQYPRILVLHLSRSIFDAFSSSRKNHADLSFPEMLKMGGFEKRVYRLQAVVTHKGGHNSGHYETFRRQGNDETDDMIDPEDDGHIRAEEGKASVVILRQPPSLAKNSKRPRDRHNPRNDESKRSKRWWRISDDRVSECRMEDVLAMRKEAYLLFYNLIMV